MKNLTDAFYELEDRCLVQLETHPPGTEVSVPVDVLKEDLVVILAVRDSFNVPQLEWTVTLLRNELVFSPREVDGLVTDSD